MVLAGGFRMGMKIPLSSIEHVRPNKKKKNFIASIEDENGAKHSTNNTITAAIINHFNQIYIGSKSENMLIDNLESGV